MSELELVSEPALGEPQWISSILHVTAGRDPLGLQTITLDRILPRLTPGILALSTRARYFSFYLFLLDEYEARHLTPSNTELSHFIKTREYELAVAVGLCMRAGCGLAAGPIGASVSKSVATAAPPYVERRESVESFLGGYGLYYKTPMTTLGLVAPAGSLLGDQPIPVDVLTRTPRTKAIADAYRSSIRGTAYYQKHFNGVGPIPLDVLREFATVGCLCRLDDFPDEQDGLREAFFGPDSGEPESNVAARRASFALFCDLIAEAPGIVRDSSSFRDAIWSRSSKRETDLNAARPILESWAAFVAKEYMQEGLSLFWPAVCRRGLERQEPEGMRPDDVVQMLRVDLVADGLRLPNDEILDLTPETPTSTLADAIARATQRRSLETIRKWALQEDEATAGLALLLELYRRLGDFSEPSPAWHDVAVQSSERQPGLTRFGIQLREHLEEKPTLADTHQWLGARHVIRAHEAIAYSKLPERTFRFKWENGLLRFYSLDSSRFWLADDRRNSLASLSFDLGLWTARDQPKLAKPGRELVDQALG